MRGSYDFPSNRRLKRRRRGCVCVRRKKVVELVIERCDGLAGNQAELGRKVVRPAF